MAEKKKVQEKKDQKAPQCAILFELENMTVNGAQVTYDLLHEIFKGKDAELTPVLFSRFCLNAAPAHYIPLVISFMKKSRLSADKLAAEINEGIKSAFSGGSLKLSPAIKKLLDRAKDKNIFTGALTSLDAETSKIMSDNLDIAKWGVKVLSCSSGPDRTFPSADAWLNLAKSISVDPGMCVAFSSNSVSSKAALSAGMRGVVITDKFSRYQDFGGADYVSDKMDDDTIDALFGLLGIK